MFLFQNGGNYPLFSSVCCISMLLLRKARGRDMVIESAAHTSLKSHDNTNTCRYQDIIKNVSLLVLFLGACPSPPISFLLPLLPFLSPPFRIRAALPISSS